MKGFAISIKNDLLERKHIERMGVSVWLYMWLIDKTTSINEEGVGLVLGGRPILFTEIEEELGIPHRTFVRWVENLRKHGYILTVKTPTGLCFRVTKAWKTFGKPTDASEAKATPKMAEGYAIYGVKATPYMAQPIKTVHLDNNKDTGETSSPVSVLKKGRPTHVRWKDIEAVFAQFSKSRQPWWNHKPQREAALRLFDLKGIEQVSKAMGFFHFNRHEKFCPQITLPYELEEKWDKLLAFKKQKEL